MRLARDSRNDMTPWVPWCGRVDDYGGVVVSGFGKTCLVGNGGGNGDVGEDDEFRLAFGHGNGLLHGLDVYWRHEDGDGRAIFEDVGDFIDTGHGVNRHGYGVLAPGGVERVDPLGTVFRKDCHAIPRRGGNEAGIDGGDADELVEGDLVILEDQCRFVAVLE